MASSTLPPASHKIYILRILERMPRMANRPPFRLQVLSPVLRSTGAVVLLSSLPAMLPLLRSVLRIAGPVPAAEFRIALLPALHTFPIAVRIDIGVVGAVRMAAWTAPL